MRKMSNVLEGNAVEPCFRQIQSLYFGIDPFSNIASIRKFIFAIPIGKSRKRAESRMSETAVLLNSSPTAAYYPRFLKDSRTFVLITFPKCLSSMILAHHLTKMTFRIIRFWRYRHCFIMRWFTSQLQQIWGADKVQYPVANIPRSNVLDGVRR